LSDTERQLLYSTFFRNEQSLINWLAFCLSRKISPANRRLLISCCSNPTEILDVTVDYRGENQPDVKLVKRLEDLKKQCYPEQLKRDIGKCLEWLVVDGQGLLVPGFPDYPSLLMEVPDKPLLLFYKGNTDLLHLPMVAIVGSRRPTVDGRRIARRFAIQLAQSGLGICSGLALGIDACSHEGALSVGGNTVAVLGTGTDRCYPEANRGLYERIGEQGVMISEFLPGTPPRAENFPRRNRIISGLALGTLVVEAGVRSGSMITARLALEQGREVFAIPGSIQNPMSRGCHRLIRQGAKLTEEISDIIEECGSLLAGLSVSPPETSVASRKQFPGKTGRIQKLLGMDRVALDTLVAESGLATEEVITVLTELELKGQVRREAGGYVSHQGD